MDSILKSRSFIWSVLTAVTVILAGIITWRFYPIWWFIIAFIDLGVFLLYVVAFVSSITFWISKRKKFTYPFVPFAINVLVILIIVLTPSSNFNKNYPKSTIDLNKYQKDSCTCHLYIKTYCVYGGGAWGTDIDSYYLTDLTNFQIYIRTADEYDQHIHVTCKGNNVLVEKTVNTSSVNEWNWPKVIEKKVYNLKELKELNNF